MPVVKMPSKNHAAKHDTRLHRITEIRCLCQSEGLNCNQGRDCPLLEKPAAPEPRKRALVNLFDWACWIAASALLIWGFRACMESKL